MTTTTGPRTVGDLERERARWMPPAPPPAPPNPQRQAIAERLAAMPTTDLQALVARRWELLRGLDEADVAAAVLELRPGVERAESAAADAAALVPQAAALVEAARQALIGPDAEITECARRIADLEEALAASVGDVTTIKTLQVELAAYRETLRDLAARRTGPADQLTAAQQALRDAQAAAAAASQAFDTERTKLGDPIRWAPGARLAYTARTCLRTLADAMAGEPVDAEEYTASRDLLQAVFDAAGYGVREVAAAERRGRDAAWREWHRMPPHMRP